jgi:hypothetical protein
MLTKLLQTPAAARSTWHQGLLTDEKYPVLRAGYFVLGSAF